MDTGNGKAESFLLGIRQTGLVRRLFSWRAIVNDAEEAYADLAQRMMGLSNSLVESGKDRQERQRLEDEKRVLDGRIVSLNDEIKTIGQTLAGEIATGIAKNGSISDLNIRLKKHEEDLKTLQEEKNKLDNKVTELNTLEEKRQLDYQVSIGNLNMLYQELTGERTKVQEVREKEIAQRFDLMKDTWRVHESGAQQAIVQLCKVHGIEYVDRKKYSLKGSPDNVVMIGGKYVIFDAKSPQGESLENFPTYIDSQVKNVSKYLEDAKVMRYVFLVVPANAIESLKIRTYPGADYSVFIVTVDSLEPILLNLKRIEEFEFAEAMSPEERENITHTVARLTHLTKRRIEIDAGMAREAMEALSRCKDLPEEMQEGIAKSEKAAILNPKMEKTGKAITDKHLKDSVGDLEKAEGEVKKSNGPFSELERKP